MRPLVAHLETPAVPLGPEAGTTADGFPDPEAYAAALRTRQPATNCVPRPPTHPPIHYFSGPPHVRNQQLSVSNNTETSDLVMLVDQVVLSHPALLQRTWQNADAHLSARLDAPIRFPVSTTFRVAWSRFDVRRHCGTYGYVTYLYSGN
ncbi:hypothetical protein HPB50_010790 [Hyalomma asiaticum]|uniref:Uncharacterized protein n=1 Tax=Hyalomma asiaticum TaxID=266040 RepID=A0ACB7RSD1_HYAAI|nr:hypothetical protein HPB50_010790 [Hyalomma asiaticum]